MDMRGSSVDRPVRNVVFFSVFYTKQKKPKKKKKKKKGEEGEEENEKLE